MDEVERVHGYTGGGGLIQAFAGGYFLWDLMVTVQHVGVFGVGMLFHAISALCVFSLGFVSTIGRFLSSRCVYERHSATCLGETRRAVLTLINSDRLSTSTPQHSFSTSSLLRSSTSTGSATSSR